MNLLTRLRITPAVHVHLAVVGRSEFDRVIELPSGASAEWLVNAYLLSLGLDRNDAHLDFDGYLDMQPSIWRSDYQTMRLPEIPHEIQVLVVDGRMPEAGDPRVAIVDAGTDAPASVVGRWQSDAPPFRVRHINNELAQRYGIVVPHFDDSGLKGGHRIPSSSRLDSLLGSLAPARRLALLAHLEDSAILVDRPLELSTVESATASLMTLFDYIGAEGLVQDAETGWVSDRDAAAVVRALEWTSVRADGVSAPGEALLSLARTSKLIRRLKGRILVTNRGRKLLEPGALTLSELARAVTIRDTPYGWASDTGSLGRTLALLAIADGSADSFAEIPALVSLGRASIEEHRSARRGYDEYWSSFDHSMTDAGTGVPVSVQQAIDRVAALSDPGRFGVISPAMREVARTALL